MTGLADGGGQTSHADTVTAHDRIMGYPFGIRILHMHSPGILISQLEYISHLNAAGQGQGVFFTGRADPSLHRLGKIVVPDAGAVPFHAQAGIMERLPVGAAGKIDRALQGVVIQNGNAGIQAAGSDITGMQSAVRGDPGRVDFLSQVIGEFGFIYVQIPA